MASGTRSKAKNYYTGVPQLVRPLRTGGITFPASSEASQRKFLEYVSLTMSKIDIVSENVFSDTMAELISQALNHEDKMDTLGYDHEDPYFTPQEWEKRMKRISDQYEDLYYCIEQYTRVRL